MSFGSDPFFGLLWGANKTSVKERVFLSRLLPNTGTWFDGQYYPPSTGNAVYRMYRGLVPAFNLDGIDFDAADFGFRKDGWIGVFHKLWFVRLDMFFAQRLWNPARAGGRLIGKKALKRMQEALEEEADEVSERLCERLCARYGTYTEYEMGGKYWVLDDSLVELFVYAIEFLDEDDRSEGTPNIVVVASAKDDKAQRPRFRALE